ncbi:TWiK family of potassium channels protein 7-like isoform X2 [Cylas formicarius]|uniref:TWiK family of potassium channels protein 7-like isoform X2 n=1 Tax=Cylas formicarius TaxID=197179 RepID=UPI0029585916|nr:TWiK family of potassium channels protein 7-like isoform X2 [Cylas formicarius]
MADDAAIEPSREKKPRPSLKIPSRTTVTFPDVPRSPEEAKRESYNRKASQFVFDQINDFRHFTVNTAKSGLGVGEKCALWLYDKFKTLSRKWFTHCFLTIVLVIYTVGGAISFTAIEGPYEDKIQEIDIREFRIRFVNDLANLTRQYYSENHTERWIEEATPKMLDFLGKVIENHKTELFIEANRGPKVWTIWNSVVFCATIYTTIGYGHMFPKTTTGRALTIVYALIGIPLFLIALTDFGKLFTRCIKFVWSFVRRLYYTGSCRRVRKQTNFDGIFKGAQSMIRKSLGTEDDEDVPQVFTPSSVHTPGSPTISAFEIDDEFNLPISVALFILVAYIFCGAVIYMVVEKWDFFESFYFVFISMSTIGFGDYVPRHPVFMIGSIVYLVFGLALMSMCINVVQAKLSDTFKEASAKIGATMGLQVDEDGTVSPESVEVPSVHATVVDEVAKTD